MEAGEEVLTPNGWGSVIKHDSLEMRQPHLVNNGFVPVLVLRQKLGGTMVTRPDSTNETVWFSESLLGQRR